LGTIYEHHQKAPVNIFEGLEIDLKELFEEYFFWHTICTIITQNFCLIVFTLHLIKNYSYESTN
jgi:hypothetical protein